MYDKDHGIVMTGMFTNGDTREDAGIEVNEIDRWHKPYFYKHCEDKMKLGKPTSELIPLRQYYQVCNRWF